MSRLNWTPLNPRYETGVDKGVYYPYDRPGLAWNGLAGVTESPSGSEVRTRYLDGVPYGKSQIPGFFAGTIEAYTYPEEFEKDVLYPRRPKKFGMSYRTMTESAYKIHLVYNVLVNPTQRTNRYLETDPYSWEFSTTPVPMPSGRTSAHMILDASHAYPEAIAAFDDILYGSDATGARLPSPTEVFGIFEANAVLIVTDHGDGTFTVTGPDEAIQMIDSTTFLIDWPSVAHVDRDTYTIRSY